MDLLAAIERRARYRERVYRINQIKEEKMKVENAVYPTAEGIRALGQDSSTKIAMLNLLKFREKAIYKDGRAENISGREAYMRYAGVMTKIVEREGGRILFTGRIAGLVIGEVGDMWDAAAIMEYPSRAAFQRIVTLPEVAEIGVHREAGLEGQLLIMTESAQM
jgi:uncharacterized protein (DUF1330 family)